jgi:hypothetical protein
MRELAARETDAAIRTRLIAIAGTFDRFCLKHLGQAEDSGKTGGD